MKVTPHYGDSAITLPGSIAEHLTPPNSGNLAVLIYTVANDEFTVSGASEALGISEDEVLAALRFWEKEGIISTEILPVRNKSNSKAPAKKTEDGKKTAKKKRGKLSATLPPYTSGETAEFIENRGGMAFLIDSCEQIIGKIFSTAEVSIIVGLMDHLSLSTDYILLLFAHAAKLGKNSVRYVERLAIDLSDRDVTEYTALSEELSALELTESTSTFVRKLYGLGRRSLTEKERGMIRNWCSDWSFANDAIERAYEITVNNTGEASLPYTNAILERWHGEGLTTLAEIDAYLEKNKNEKPSKKGKKKSAEESASSFDTDDFFEAALKRSYGE